MLLCMSELMTANLPKRKSPTPQESLVGISNKLFGRVFKIGILLARQQNLQTQMNPSASPYFLLHIAFVEGLTVKMYNRI